MLTLFQIITIIALFLVKTKAQGDCEFLEITTEEWDTLYLSDSILDLRSGLIRNLTEATNVLGVVSVEGPDSIYYDVEYNDETKQLDIFTSSQFGNFEDELVASSPYTMTMDITLQCTTGTRVLHYNQPVQDTNNHECVFNNASYTYVLPMPLPPTELTTIFPVYATDLDYSNTMLNFVIIEPIDYMAFEWIGQYEGNPKQYQASLRTTLEINIVEPVVITLVVTDFNWVEVAYLTLIPEGWVGPQ